jgi:hypothetical protein
MRYCPDCGTPHECDSGDMQARIRLAEIEANRDIEIARLGASTDRIEAAAAVEIAESEAVIDAAHAEGEAEGMETVLEAGAAPEPEPGAEPVIAVIPGGDSEPGTEGESPPPPPETEAPESAEPKRAGYWDMYR